jgi:hypothetical protein
MPKHAFEVLSLHFPARNRKRKRRTDQKGKGGLDQVMQGAPLPFNVLGVEGDLAP